MRRTMAIIATTVFAGLGLAVPANAYAPYPADCTVVHPVSRTAVMTCTGRPVAQHWHEHVDCIGPWIDSEATGNSVVGNGTSTASCPWGNATDVTFVPEP